MGMQKVGNAVPLQTFLELTGGGRGEHVPEKSTR
jgi:hypothetical protein